MLSHCAQFKADAIKIDFANLLVKHHCPALDQELSVFREKNDKQIKLYICQEIYKKKTNIYI